MELQWAVFVATTLLSVFNVKAQFDFGSHTTGERSGELSTAAVAGVTVAVLAGVGALCVTMFFCYYVYTKNKRATEIHIPVRKY